VIFSEIFTIYEEGNHYRVTATSALIAPNKQTEK